MTKKENRNHFGKSNVTEATLKSEAKTLKDNPVGETVCSPYFSQGCLNEDTDLSMKTEGEDEHEKH